MAEPLKMPKTYQQQIDNLVNNHGMLIADRAKAEEILSTVNYYRLSAYGIGLKQPANMEMYQPGISLEHIYHLYQFDSQLRNILIPLLEYVEIAFRTKLAYQLAMAYGAEGYRDPAHFLPKLNKDKTPIHRKVMDQLDAEIDHKSNFPCVMHHLKKYGGHFPVWAAMELFGFGMACSLFSVCSNQDRKKIASEFSMRPQQLYGWMLSLLELRNMCAHYNRIYNMFFKQPPYLPPQYVQYNSNRLFPKLLILKALVKQDAWERFVNRLQDLFHKYPEARADFMGFPPNWVAVLKGS